jgi:hypothetical protein
MNISRLPYDVIKHIESFVDKRPPFAVELAEFVASKRPIGYYYSGHNDFYTSNPRYPSGTLVSQGFIKIRETFMFIECNYSSYNATRSLRIPL